ncbi:MAG: manganese/zinc/iron transport system substrate-binding protein [Candidatus Marinamargulisbacteria bacterium]|jgi:manganese/zinc/iron transport system substrate-binding protein
MKNKNMAKLWIGALVILIFAAWLKMGVGVSDKAGAMPTNEDKKIKIVCTIGMITDIVEKVGGVYVDVDGLMGPGVDPHLYRASAGDVSRLAAAQIIFFNGLHLEAKMGEILEQMNGRKVTVAVTDLMPREKLTKPPEFEGLYDPHVWFDVALWRYAVDQVQASLSKFAPEHEADFLKNADIYRLEMKKLDGEIRAKVKGVSKDQRVLVTAHDAFGYFGRAYGFEVKALQGISTDSEAGTKDVQKLASFIAQRKIKAIFIESSIPRRNIEAVQAAVRAKGWDVAIGGELFSDAMGNPGTPEGEYLGMVRHNVSAIVLGLIAGKSGHKGHAHTDHK